MENGKNDIVVIAESLLRMRLGNCITTRMTDLGYKNYSELNLSVELKDNWPYDREYEEILLSLLVELSKKLNLKINILDLELIPEKAVKET